MPRVLFTSPLKRVRRNPVQLHRPQAMERPEGTVSTAYCTQMLGAPTFSSSSPPHRFRSFASTFPLLSSRPPTTSISNLAVSVSRNEHWVRGTVSLQLSQFCSLSSAIDIAPHARYLAFHHAIISECLVWWCVVLSQSVCGSIFFFVGSISDSGKGTVPQKVPRTP